MSLEIKQVTEEHYSDIILTADNGIEPAKKVTIKLDEMPIDNQGQGEGPAHKIESPAPSVIVEVVTEPPKRSTSKPSPEVKGQDVV